MVIKNSFSAFRQGKRLDSDPDLNSDFRLDPDPKHCSKSTKISVLDPDPDSEYGSGSRG